MGMIVDAIYPTGHGLYAQPSIYMRTRDEHGNTHVQITNPEAEDHSVGFLPLQALEGYLGSLLQ